MRLIKLTQGKFAKVDDKDFKYFNQFKWNAHKRGNSFYAESRMYVRGQKIKNRDKRKVFILHNEIMNPKKGFFVDHKNRDGLDCQRKNLRIVTKSQNNANRCASKNGTSKYLGVAWYSQTKRWSAKVRKDGKVHWLGYFKKEKDAARAYDKKAKELHGEFANPNFK